MRWIRERNFAMKKCIATLLAASMLLSLAACAKKEETTKKKKTKKTTEETEDTEETDEPTEDTTETTEATTTTSEPTPISTSETSQVTPAPDGQLTYLGLDYPQQDNDWGAVMGESELGYVHFKCDDLYLLEVAPGVSPKLQDAIDDVILDHQDFTQNTYNADREVLFTLKGNDEAEGYQHTYRFATELFREDTQVFSFAITESYDFKEDEYETYNFHSNDGTPIPQSEVIVDKSAFIEYMKSTLEPIGDNDWINSMAALAEKEELPFTMTYDGINLLYPGFYPYTFTYVKIPVSGAESLFNMDYFKRAPQYFTLFSDRLGDESVIWDFDGDGKDDVVEATSEYDDTKGACVVHLKYNGNEYKTTDEGLYLNDNALMDFCIMNTDSGYYLCATMTGVDSSYDIAVFKMENGTFKHIVTYEFLRFSFTGFINPERFEMTTSQLVLGIEDFYNQFTAIGNNGMIDYEYGYFSAYGMPYITRADITGELLDEDLNTEKSNFTIPSGSAIQAAYYNPTNDKLILNVITEHAEDQYYVLVDYSIPEDMPKINGEALCDILENYDYAF